MACLPSFVPYLLHSTTRKWLPENRESQLYAMNLCSEPLLTYGCVDGKLGTISTEDSLISKPLCVPYILTIRNHCKLIFSNHVQMAMLTPAGAVPDLEEVEDLFTSTSYNVLAQNTNLQTVPILIIQMSMTTTIKIGVSLVGMVNSSCIC